MDYFHIFMLGIAISFDGFFVGFTYGIRKVDMNIPARLLISGISGITIFITILFGCLVGNLFSERITEYLGGLILIVVGFWIILQNLRQSLEHNLELRRIEDNIIVTLRIPWLGIAIQILREPMAADFDKSGSINMREASFLGLALALDAVGAGLGAGLAGAHFLITPLVIFFLKMVSISLGSFAGNKLDDLTYKKMAFLPGLILLLLGFSKWI